VLTDVRWGYPGDSRGAFNVLERVGAGAAIDRVEKKFLHNSNIYDTKLIRIEEYVSEGSSPFRRWFDDLDTQAPPA